MMDDPSTPPTEDYVALIDSPNLRWLVEEISDGHLPTLDHTRKWYVRPKDLSKALKRRHELDSLHRLTARFHLIERVRHIGLPVVLAALALWGSVSSFFEGNTVGGVSRLILSGLFAFWAWRRSRKGKRDGSN